MSASAFKVSTRNMDALYQLINRKCQMRQDDHFLEYPFRVARTKTLINEGMIRNRCLLLLHPEIAADPAHGIRMNTSLNMLLRESLLSRMIATPAAIDQRFHLKDTSGVERVINYLCLPYFVQIEGREYRKIGSQKELRSEFQVFGELIRMTVNAFSRGFASTRKQPNLVISTGTFLPLNEPDPDDLPVDIATLHFSQATQNTMGN